MSAALLIIRCAAPQWWRAPTSHEKREGRALALDNAEIDGDRIGSSSISRSYDVIHLPDLYDRRLRTDLEVISLGLSGSFARITDLPD